MFLSRTQCAPADSLVASMSVKWVYKHFSCIKPNVSLTQNKNVSPKLTAMKHFTIRPSFGWKHFYLSKPSEEVKGEGRFSQEALQTWIPGLQHGAAGLRGNERWSPDDLHCQNMETMEVHNGIVGGNGGNADLEIVTKNRCMKKGHEQYSSTALRPKQWVIKYSELQNGEKVHLVNSSVQANYNNEKVFTKYLKPSLISLCRTWHVCIIPQLQTLLLATVKMGWAVFNVAVDFVHPLQYAFPILCFDC